MDGGEKARWFDDVDTIVAEPVLFKSKLGIGEDAYSTLRMKNAVANATSVVGASAAGATVAGSSTVAAFFSNSLLVSLGLATTPIGWVVAAAIASGTACYGISRYLEKYTKDRVVVIPRFLNSPMDALAISIFDLLAPLAMKIAHADNKIVPSELDYIHGYFVKEWGYDATFVCQGLAFIEFNLDRFNTRDLAGRLTELQKTNVDCHFDSMSREIENFLNNIVEADGVIDHREEQAVADVKRIFEEAGASPLRRVIPFSSRWAKTRGASTGGKTDDIIAVRLESATDVELGRMCLHLGLDPSSSVRDIVHEYKSSAGNSFANIARNWGLVERLTYKEILIDVIEKIRPINDDIDFYMKKIRSAFARNDGQRLADWRSEESIVEDLENILMGLSRKKIEQAFNTMDDAKKSALRNESIEEVRRRKNDALCSHSCYSGVLGSLFSVAVSRGVFMVAGGTAAGAVALFLIPATVGGPAYRKIISATLELILIGRRQRAERLLA